MAEQSYYINSSFYDQLTQEKEQDANENRISDMNIVRECEAVLFQEARLLDDLKFDDWIDLFTEECLYWIPASYRFSDPRKEVSTVFDDRRRLLDRIARFQTGRAHSQLLPSRTRRLITNTEAWSLDGDSRRKVYSNFVIYELRNHCLTPYPGHYEHILKKENDVWKIERKSALLINADEPLNNLTFVV